MSGCPRSTSARNSSIEQTDFFFEAVQFHLQPPNFFVQRVAGSFPVPPFATVHEELRKLFQRTLPPFRNLDGMHLELRTQLTQRLLAAHRLDRNPRFELRTILLSRRRHRPLLCQRLRRNLTLLPGLKSGDHYTPRFPLSFCTAEPWVSTFQWSGLTIAVFDIERQFLCGLHPQGRAIVSRPPVSDSLGKSLMVILLL